MFRLLLTVALLAASAHGVRRMVASMEIKTADDFLAGMTLGQIDIDILPMDTRDLPCEMNHLDNPFTNDFEDGQIDIFEGLALQDCRRYNVDDYEVYGLKLEHHNYDGWKPEWFRVVFEDGVFVQCDDGQWIDNNEVRNVTTCYRVGGGDN